MRRRVGLIAFAIAVAACIDSPAQTSSGQQRTAAYLLSIRQQPPLLLAFLHEMPKGGDLAALRQFL